MDDSGISLLDKMDENKWYRVRFNADGEVTSVRSDNIDANGDSIPNNANDGDKYANDGRPDQDLSFDKNWDLYAYDETTDKFTNTNAPYAYVWNYAGGAINSAINTKGVDTVLYHQIFGANEKPSNDGKTFYVTNIEKDGYIRYTDDTAVIFEQENNNEWTTEFWAGQSGVERALRELRLGDQKGYSISALIEDGRALTIIIRDNSEDGDDGSWSESNMIQNKNVTLWGDKTTLITLETAGVGVNYWANQINFTFTALDADGDKIVNDDVLYDVDVYVNDHHDVYRDNVAGKSDDTGRVAGVVNGISANADDEIVVRISNVRTEVDPDVPTVPEDVIVSFEGSNVYVSGTQDLAVAIQAIKNELADKGYTNVDVKATTSSGATVFTFSATKTVAGVPVTDEYTYNSITGNVAPITVTVDGNEVKTYDNKTVGDVVSDFDKVGYVTLNGDLAKETDALKNGDVIATKQGEIEGTNSTVYGKPGEKIGVAASEAMAGNYLSDGTAIEDAVFGAAGVDHKVTDNYFSFTVDGSESFQKAGTKITIGGSDTYALVNGEIVTVSEYNAAENTVEDDVVIAKGYVELTVTDDADTEVLGENSIAWGKGVVEQDGKFYAQKGAKVTLTLTTAEFTVDETDYILKISTTSSNAKTSLVEILFEQGSLGAWAQGDKDDKQVTFGAGETYQPGTIVVELTVGTADTNVTLDWANV